MARFVVIGEGRPAEAVLDYLAEAPGALVEALVLRDPQNSPLGEFAEKRQIRVVDVSRFEDEAAGVIGNPGGWLLNVNSTAIISADVLNLFEGRSLNLHPGLLPEYAGLHTHQWAIRNGELEFGVTVHRMERRIDAGAIVGQRRFPIRPDDTGLTLFGRCLAAGTELFSGIVARIVRGETLNDVPQDLTRQRIYRHRDALDGRIDWNDSAQKVVDFVRAGNYEPLASPTYVARLDPVAGFAIEVLRAAVEEGSREASPGTIVDVSASGPLIACGDGSAIRIVRARNGRQTMTPPAWSDYFSRLSSPRLLGRCETQK